MSADDTKICPACGETIKQVATKCRYCNTILSSYKADQGTETEKPLYTGHPAIIYSAWQYLWVVLTVGIAYLYYWLQSIGTTYRITTQRIKIERGVLSKTQDSVELFTIEHHAGEEEDEMFTKVRKSNMDLVALGEEIAASKEQWNKAEMPLQPYGSSQTSQTQPHSR